MSIPFSCVIITKNEEKHIARCLESISFANDIVIVDALSSDHTKSICQSFANRLPIRFFERHWTGFKDQRNFALDQAKYEWVLVLDADERVSPELAKHLEKLLSQTIPLNEDAYKIRRQEYFLGKEIHFGIWNPSNQDRFFKKTGIRYINNIHEYPAFPKSPGRIQQPILHSPTFRIEAFLDKMNRYTSIEAQDRVNAGQRTNAFRILFAFPAMFLKNYFYYNAYKDGYRGFVISILEGISRAVRHVKIWQYTLELSKKETERK
jgi:glycosyltransferase involved in cell wall biosynthesis